MCFEFCLIFVNGYEKDENYILQNGDVCTIRQYPSNDTSSALSWIFRPISSFVKGCWSGDWSGANSFMGLNDFNNPSYVSSNTEKSSDKSIEELPTVAGATNGSAENRPVPIFFGKHLYTPNWCGNSYTTIAGTDGEEQYINTLFMCGYNPINVTNLRFGVFDIADNRNKVLSGTIPMTVYDSKKEEDVATRFSDFVSLEIQKENETSLYPYKVAQENFDEEIMTYKDDVGVLHRLTLDKFSAKNPYKVEVEFKFDGLVKWNDKGAGTNTSVQIKVEYSKDGETYYPFGQVGSDAGSYNSSTGITTITRAKAKTLRFVATRTFSYSDLYNSDGTSKLTNGVIHLRITRYDAQDINNDNIVDTVKLSAIRTWTYDKVETESKGYIVQQRPVVEPLRKKTVRIAMKIKATEDSEKLVSEFNFIGSALGRTYTDNTWSDDYTETQNPASMGLLCLQGLHRGAETYNDNEIDLEAMGEFYNFCARKGFKCNGVVTDQLKTSELYAKILTTGRGFRVDNGSKRSVCFDDYRTNVVNVINNQNCISANNSKNIDKLPDGYLARFQDENNYYQETEYVVCFNDNNANKTDLDLEELNIPFVTDSHQLYKLLKYHCAVKSLRRELWSRKMSVDGNLIEVGNLVELQDDTILVGIGSGAEIKEVVIENEYITKLKFDTKFEITDATKNYGIKIVQADGVNEPLVMKKQVVNAGVGSYDTFTLSDPISVYAVRKPCVQDLVSFGLYDKITISGLCASKRENSDGTFDMTFVPYVEGIYTADEGTIPPFDSKVTTPTGDISIGSENFDTVTREQLASATENLMTESELDKKVQNIKIFQLKSLNYTDGVEENAIGVYENKLFRFNDGQWNELQTDNYIGILGSFPSASYGLNSYFLWGSDRTDEKYRIATEEGIIVTDDGKEIVVDSFHFEKGYIYLKTKLGWQKITDKDDWRYIVAMEDVLEIGGTVTTNVKSFMSKTVVDKAPKYLGGKGTEENPMPTSANQGDWCTYIGATDFYTQGQVYTYNNGEWTVDTNPDHLIGALDDILTLNLGAENGSFANVLCKKLVSNEAFIKQLVSETLKVTGSIRTGDLYNADGTIAEGHETDAGCYMGANGVFKAQECEIKNAQVTGELRTQNGLKYSHYLHFFSVNAVGNPYQHFVDMVKECLENNELAVGWNLQIIFMLGTSLSNYTEYEIDISNVNFNYYTDGTKKMFFNTVGYNLGGSIVNIQATFNPYETELEKQWEVLVNTSIKKVVDLQLLVTY